MNTLFLASLLGVASTSSLCATSFAAPALPREVRAYLPKGATSFLSKRLPIGPKVTPVFVHIWGATRPNTSASLNAYNQFSASPFCVDVFAPVQDQKKRWSWELASSTAYIDESEPTEIRAHWLQPAKKQGPILHIVSSSGAPGVSTEHKLLVWDKGFRQGYRAPTPQEFSSGGCGGGSIFQTYNILDERGFLVVTSQSSTNGQSSAPIRYLWNGERFVATEAK